MLVCLQTHELLAQDRPERAQTLQLFHSYCSLTWQTPPFKGTNSSAAMICFSGAEMDGNKIYLCKKQRGTQTTIQDGFHLS